MNFTVAGWREKNEVSTPSVSCARRNAGPGTDTAPGGLERQTLSTMRSASPYAIASFAVR